MDNIVSTVNIDYFQNSIGTVSIVWFIYIPDSGDTYSPKITEPFDKHLKNYNQSYLFMQSKFSLFDKLPSVTWSVLCDEWCDVQWLVSNCVAEWCVSRLVTHVIKTYMYQ